ncbi:MAG: SWIM zinc finger domain-containing protein [Mangrovibacterium sp.]
MAVLFTTKENDLPGFFNAISAEDIRNRFEPDVYGRGLRYFRNGTVAEASFNAGKTELKALVKGRSDYAITVSLNNGKVSGICTCPYGGTCKHIAATLFYANDAHPEIEVVPEPADKENEYLQGLSKEELISLVKQYAPEQFWVKVRNQFSDSTSASGTFSRAERKIRKIFSGGDSLYDPDEFSESLDNEIKRLSGLEKHLKAEIEGLVFYIIDEVENAFNEGYLYNDYNDSHYEPSAEFDDFIIHYLQCLDYAEKTAFLEKLDHVLSEQSYTAFYSWHRLSGNVFTDEDLPSLKSMLVSNYKTISSQLLKDYYERVRHLLSFREKETLLTEIQDHSTKWIIELAGLYASQEQERKAIESVKTWLRNNNGFGNEDLYSLYLGMIKKAGGDFCNVAKEAITHCSTCSMLQKIASLESNSLQDYMSILEKKRPEELLIYLEADNQLEEAVALINRSIFVFDDHVCEFYKKHKKQFPHDAEKYFCGRIDKNIINTGDRYYYTVADSIKELKQVNTKLASEYLQQIRAEYKRRRNLIAILSNI